MLFMAANWISKAVAVGVFFFLVVLLALLYWPIRDPPSKPRILLTEDNMMFDEEGRYFCPCLNQTVSHATKSKCNSRSDERGEKQKVLSFCYYGENVQRYFQGAIANAEFMKMFYPDWVLRLHVDIEETAGQWDMCKLLCAYPFLDVCDIRNISGFPNLAGAQPNAWRFIALADPLVDVVLLRDSDSRPSAREVEAVNEWLASNLTFHVMRDHKFHSIEILAGMWGAKNKDDRDLMRSLATDMLSKKAGKKGFDQQMLRSLVWPKMKGRVMQHDSYFCKTGYKTNGNMVPFPTQRPNTNHNFIGARIGIDVKPTRSACPMECRKKPDWEFC